VSYRPLLKICGVTNPEDARLVGALGADFCGLVVDVEFSERRLSVEEARRVASVCRIPVVVLLCNPSVEQALEAVGRIGAHALQLLCSEPPELVAEMKARASCRIWKTVHLPPAPGQSSPEAYVKAGADALLVDSSDTSRGFLRLGGTGKVGDWRAAAALVAGASVPVFLAGGIGPDNVEKALVEVRPHGIDLSSGVEGARKGKKDPEKVRALIENFRRAVCGIEGDRP
jgi:phosphoribosylanthranilate isomerase